ncbi:MAG: inositol monophosphatase family protein [Leptospirales bacterium]
MSDINELSKSEIDQCCHVVREAGNRILTMFQEKSFTVSYKEKKHPVTNADYEANNYIVSNLNKLFPDEPILSEETSEFYTRDRMDKERQNAKRLWVIDPLDGTKEFIDGVPNFSISVALLLNNKAEFGIIFNPAEDFFIQGGKNYGLFVNGQKADGKKTTDFTDLKSIKIALSYSETQSGNFQDLTRALQTSDNTLTIGSVAYKLGLLAGGKIDLVLSRRPKSSWDIAGGAALLEAANMTFLDQLEQPVQLNGPSILTNGIIAGSPSAVELYQKFLRSST